jgi:hypothetical protein
METNKTRRTEIPTPLELNRKLIFRGVKALQEGTLKVTIAGYLRLQRNTQLPPVQTTPPVWIEK